MDLSIDRAVDDPGLEARVLMAKAYRRRHRDAVGDQEFSRSPELEGKNLAEARDCSLIRLN